MKELYIAVSVFILVIFLLFLGDELKKGKTRSNKKMILWVAGSIAGATFLYLSFAFFPAAG